MKCTVFNTLISTTFIVIFIVTIIVGARHSGDNNLRSRDSEGIGIDSRLERTSNRRSRSTNRDVADSSEQSSTGRGGAQHSNCSQCSGGSSVVNRDAKRNYRLESIKADILRKLHLRSPPNITGRQLPALPHLQQIIDKLSITQSDGRMDYDTDSYDGNPAGNGEEQWEESDGDRATTMKIIQVSKPVPQDRLSQASLQENVCYFPFPMSEVHHINQVVRLTFGVYARPTAYDPRGPHRASLLIISILGPGGYQKILRTKRINLSSHGTGRWHYFTLTPTDIQGWLSHPNTNYGLLIQSSNGRGEPLAVVTPRNAEEEPFRPYLEVETREISNTRTKRHTDMNCDERSTEKSCCRYPLEVDFTSFQWDWIIVPTRYSAYFCAGECPYLFVQQYGNSYINQLARPNGAGGPCCSPRKVSSISMLYYDQNMNIVYGRIPGMVVDRCGCS